MKFEIKNAGGKVNYRSGGMVRGTAKAELSGIRKVERREDRTTRRKQMREKD